MCIYVRIEVKERAYRNAKKKLIQQAAPEGETENTILSMETTKCTKRDSKIFDVVVVVVVVES